MKTTYTILATATLIVQSLFSYATLQDSADFKNELTIEIVTINHPSCNGKSDGSVIVQVSGGEIPYSYSWNTFPEQQTQNATNLKSGIYFIEVKDASGRIAFRSVEILDPINTSVSNQVTASQQSQIVHITPINNQDNLIILVDGKTETHQNAITNLDVGIYKLIVHSQNNCTLVQFIQVVAVENTSQTETVLTPLENDKTESMVVLK